MTENAGYLEQEVRYLHASFFRGNPPSEIVERYAAAHQVCGLPEEDHIVSTIVSRNLDAEAVELILRLRRGNPVLTRKIQILFYLVEVRSRYYSYFVSGHTGFTRASFDLLTSTARTVWKLIKGTYLVRRYGLI